MELKKWIENKNFIIDKSRIFFNEPMNKHTSFKIGGKAECFIKVKSIEELKQIIQEVNKENKKQLKSQKEEQTEQKINQERNINENKKIRENGIPITILGNGSNVLVRDKGIKGIVIEISIEQLEIQEKEKIEIKVGAGNKLSNLAHKLAQKSIKGLEFASGIPGTIGGAIKMNAGAYGKEMKDIIKTVTCMDREGNIHEIENKELNFEYRHSIFFTNDLIILGAKLELEKGKKEEIESQMNEYLQNRKEKQPIEYPSAGSTFKRGNDFITAKLIDEAGLKGKTIGGACVSEKHAGFIINKQNATAKDVLELVEYVKKIVKEKFNKEIELEVQIIGEE